MSYNVQSGYSKTGHPIILCGVKKMVRVERPWEYPYGHRSYAPPRWGPYTLLIYASGFMQRIYDSQGIPRRVS